MSLSPLPAPDPGLAALAGDVLATQYGLAPGSFRLFALGRRVLGVETPGQRLALKLHDDHVRPSLPALQELYAACAAAGLTPGLFPDRSGRLLGIHAGAAYSLHAHVRPDPGSGTPDPGALADRLFQLHATMRECCPGIALENHFERHPETLAARAAALYPDHGAELAEASRRLLASEPHQPVHGDPHPGNILQSRGALLFLDLDSATRLPAASEAALAALRFYWPDLEKTGAFLAAYARASGRPRMPWREFWLHVAHHALQRVHFILAAAERGDQRWTYDLAAQRDRLDAARQALFR